MASREPALWQEILRMAVQQSNPLNLDYGPLIEYITIVVGDTTVFADLREQLLAGRIAVELTTDETPPRVFVVSTHATSSTDWIQTVCL